MPPAGVPQALAETDLREVGPCRYEAFLPEAWTALQGVHGGFVASLAVRAVMLTMADPSRTLRAATFGFLRGVRPGPATLAVEEIRTGRSLATYHVSVAQGDGPASVVGRLHLSPPWEGAEFTEVKPPELIERPPGLGVSASRAGRDTFTIFRRGFIPRRCYSRETLVPVGWPGRAPLIPTVSVRSG